MNLKKEDYKITTDCIASLNEDLKDLQEEVEENEIEEIEKTQQIHQSKTMIILMVMKGI
jgi:hypothetical protein